MKPIAIVYTSRAGHTRQYARLLGERMLELLRGDESYVCTENLAGILQWYGKHSKERSK